MLNCGCRNQQFPINNDYKNGQNKIICQCCGKQFIELHSHQQFNNSLNSNNNNWTHFVVLLKPTRGEFSRYNFGDDLHVGILHPSTKLVISFCEFGIVYEEFVECWAKFGAIILLKMASIEENEFHDFLKLYERMFTAKEYSSTNWNCFDFVISFIRSKYLLYNFTKEEFVRQHVLPKILSICSRNNR